MPPTKNIFQKIITRLFLILLSSAQERPDKKPRVKGVVLCFQMYVLKWRDKNYHIYLKL